MPMHWFGNVKNGKAAHFRLGNAPPLLLLIEVRNENKVFVRNNGFR